MFENIADVYDSSRPVDDFLCLEFKVVCFVCKQEMEPGMAYLILMRMEAEGWMEQMGPLLHDQHVVLVDLID